MTTKIENGEDLISIFAGGTIYATAILVINDFFKYAAEEIGSKFGSIAKQVVNVVKQFEIKGINLSKDLITDEETTSEDLTLGDFLGVVIMIALNVFGNEQMAKYFTNNGTIKQFIKDCLIKAEAALATQFDAMGIPNIFNEQVIDPVVDTAVEITEDLFGIGQDDTEAVQIEDNTESGSADISTELEGNETESEAVSIQDAYDDALSDLNDLCEGIGTYDSVTEIADFIENSEYKDELLDYLKENEPEIYERVEGVLDGPNLYNGDSSNSSGGDTEKKTTENTTLEVGTIEIIKEYDELIDLCAYANKGMASFSQIANLINESEYKDEILKLLKENEPEIYERVNSILNEIEGA